MSTITPITQLTSKFIADVHAYITEAANTALLDSFARIAPKQPERPTQQQKKPAPKKAASASPPTKKTRVDGRPAQMCPVPKCRNRAAPVFGMLCTQHKNTSKKLVAKYREARRKAQKK